MLIVSENKFWKQDISTFTEANSEETWVKIDPIWVSSLGRAIDSEGHILSLSIQNKWTFKRVVYPRNKTLAIAFKITDFEKLSDPTFIVNLKDKLKPFSVENLIVCKRGTVMNQTIAEKAETEQTAFTEKDSFKQIPHKPGYAINSSGFVFNICNLNRPLKSVNNGKNVFRFRDELGTQHTQYIDILVCMLFKPFNNLSLYNEYIDQCIICHKNGNLRDDQVQNLEVSWKDSDKEFQRKQAECQRKKDLVLKVQNWLNLRGAKLVSETEMITSVHSIITYFCRCETTFTKIIKDCIETSFCMTCKSKETQDSTVDPSLDFAIGTEVFVKIPGGWVSKQGNFLNAKKEPLLINDEGYVQLLGSKQNARWCIAKAFKLENYLKLGSDGNEEFIVYQIDPSNGYHVDNLRVVTKEHYHKSILSDTAREHLMCHDDVKNIESKTVSDFPNFIFFKNGIVYNKKSRIYSKGKLNKKGFRVIQIGKDYYPMERLICYAFHSIESKTSYVDYEDLTVIFIKTKKDNNADNLKWNISDKNSSVNSDSSEKKLSNRDIKQIKVYKGHAQGELEATFTTIKDTVAARDIGKTKLRELIEKGGGFWKGYTYVPSYEVSETVIPKSLEGEVWASTDGGFVSSLGRACNGYGKLLDLDEKFRWYMNSKHQYAAIIIAKAFKVQGYENLENSHYVVRYHDKVRSNIHLYNLFVGTRKEVGEENSGHTGRTRQEDEPCFEEYSNNYKFIILDEFPHFLLFETGKIYTRYQGGTGRFLKFTTSNDYNSKSYYRFLIDSKTNLYVHRLICLAYHPIDGLDLYKDYDYYQVNHKDGNTLNNHKDNLEWVSKSENMQHAYDTGLNKKVQGVKQFEKNEDGSKGSFLKEFMSIAAASRSTKVPEHEIRTVSQGKTQPIRNFFWEFTDPEKAKEWSKKFDKHI